MKEYSLTMKQEWSLWIKAEKFSLIGLYLAMLSSPWATYDCLESIWTQDNSREAKLSSGIHRKQWKGKTSPPLLSEIKAWASLWGKR